MKHLPLIFALILTCCASEKPKVRIYYTDEMYYAVASDSVYSGEIVSESYSLQEVLKECKNFEIIGIKSIE
jgi:uncharacterized lipoprotein YmbA